MPPPGSADSGSDDPPSESSDTATSEPKTFLVMSGGEGYIDFRMGEYVPPLAPVTKQRCSAKYSLRWSQQVASMFPLSEIQNIKGCS